MPRHNVTLNLPGFTIKKTSGYNPIIYDVEYQRKSRCPYCKSKKLRLKDSFLRTFEHETIGFRRVMLRIQVNKYLCRDCNKYFRQRFEGILPWQRVTEPLKKQLYKLHSQGISRKDLSDNHKKSDGTISRIYNHVYELENRKLLSMVCPKVLGIDEHHFSKKDGYATTLCDLRKHKIFDVVKGRSSKDLASYLLSLEGRDRVQVVCMDLSSTYRGIVRKYFPNAKIVADRFHVIALINQHFIKTCRKIDPSIKHDRGVLAMLRKNPSNLTERQLNRRDIYFKKHPAIKAVYDFKQDLHKLMMNKACTAKACKKLIPKLLDYINMLKSSNMKHMITLGRTVQNWQEEIARMWRFTKSNGITGV